jgi:hypothetical protein
LHQSFEFPSGSGDKKKPADDGSNPSGAIT